VVGIAASGTGTAQANCPAGKPHAVSGGGRPSSGALAYVVPMHGSTILKSGQVPTGWQAKAATPGTKVTVFATCAP